MGDETTMDPFTSSQNGGRGLKYQLFSLAKKSLVKLRSTVWSQPPQEKAVGCGVGSGLTDGAGLGWNEGRGVLGARFSVGRSDGSDVG